jgi:hypothetical protein
VKINSANRWPECGWFVTTDFKSDGNEYPEFRQQFSKFVTGIAVTPA